MNTQNQTESCKVNNTKIWQTLILHNCLPLGEHARFTSKNVAQYLLGSRNDYNVFKFNEIKHLLLKFTPLVESIFRSKVILTYRVGSVSKTRYIKPIPPKDEARLRDWKARMKNVKIAIHNKMFYYKTLTNKRPVKILFASTNPTYAEIIQTSAETCQMNASTNRWLCGFITANSQYLGQQLKVQKKLNTFVSNTLIEKQFEKTFSENKEAKEKRYKWHNFNTLTHRPAIAIIPDIINNDMILRETLAKNIPVIGLVNSNESTRIAYPIFGNSDSVQIVNFFCNFLAALIAKTFAAVEYKQTSHRIFNRTRAFINNKKKKTVNTSVDTTSKTKILGKTNVFPWAKRWLRNKKRPKFILHYSRNDTRNEIKYSLRNFAQYKSRKKYKKIVVKKNNEEEKVVIITKRLRYIGQQPYWKNVRTMMYMLAKYVRPRKNSSAWFKQRALQKREKRLLKLYKMKKNKITSKDGAKIINLKKNKHNLANVYNVENYLFEKFAQKLTDLKQKKTLNLLKKTLKKDNKKYFRKFKSISNEIAKAGRIEAVLPPRIQKYYKLGALWKISKKHKRKALIKVFGHKNIVRKRKRFLFQWRIKRVRFYTRIKLNRQKRRQKYKKWHQRKKTKIKVTPFKRNHAVIERILNSIINLKTQRATNLQTKVFSNIYRNLKRAKIRSIKLTRIYKKRKLAKYFKSSLRSPILTKTMLKKYPYYTLLVKSLINNRKPALWKNMFNILSYELTNKKNNPYKFSISKLYRQHKISNTILWRKQYFQNWVIKWKKKRFAQIPRRLVFFKLAKIERRGLIGRSKPNNKYYFKRLKFLSNSKRFSRFIKKFKKSTNKVLFERSIKRKKRVGYYHRKLRRYIFKFRNFHNALPRTAHRYNPWRPNFRNRYRKKKHKVKNFDSLRKRIKHSFQLKMESKRSSQSPYTSPFIHKISTNRSFPKDINHKKGWNQKQRPKANSKNFKYKPQSKNSLPKIYTKTYKHKLKSGNQESLAKAEVKKSTQNVKTEKDRQAELNHTKSKSNKNTKKDKYEKKQQK